MFASPLLLLAACSEQGFGKYTPPTDVAPDIEVDPERIDFGTLTSSEVEVEEFTITNVGNSDLEIDDIQIVDDEDDAVTFAILTEDVDFTLAPGESEDIEVAFTPLVANAHAEAEIESNDPDEAVVEVDLLGEAAVPTLEITPDPYDYGTEYVGCGGDNIFTLTNVGTELLIVDSLEQVGAGYTLVNALDFPLELEPDESAEVTIEFAPTVVGSFPSELRAISNDPRGAVVATQEGEAQYVAERFEEFPIPVNPPVDILFAVDQSCSMDSFATQLGDNFSTLIEEIQNVTSNWQIGVATLSSGCFTEGILTSTTPDVGNRFQDAVIDTYGEPNYGYDIYMTESLFLLTLEALGQSNGCNAGFLRTDALLHVVFVTDEYEHSSMTASTYISQASAYKASQSLFKASGVVCPDTGCPTGGGLSVEGYVEEYLPAIQQSGGERIDITDSNWGAAAAQLAAASVSNLYTFGLDQTPDPSSIKVYVDGVEWTSDWHYDAGMNAIVFEMTELIGTTVRVEYGEIPDCGG